MKLIIVLALSVLPACSWWSSHGKDDLRASLVDCTTASASKLIEELGPTVATAISYLRDGSGRIDTARVKSTLRSVGRSEAACVAMDLIASALSGRRSFAGGWSAEDAAALRAVRHELWPDVRFRTADGVL